MLASLYMKPVFSHRLLLPLYFGGGRGIVVVGLFACFNSFQKNSFKEVNCLRHIAGHENTLNTLFIIG